MIKNINEWLSESEQNSSENAKGYDIYSWIKIMENSFVDNIEDLETIIKEVLEKINAPIVIDYRDSFTLYEYSAKLFTEARNNGIPLFRSTPLALYFINDYLIASLVDNTVLFCEMKDISKFEYTNNIKFNMLNDVNWVKKNIDPEYLEHTPLSNNVKAKLKSRITKHKFDF